MYDLLLIVSQIITVGKSDENLKNKNQILTDVFYHNGSSLWLMINDGTR